MDNDTTSELDGEDIVTHDEVSDEVLEAAAATYGKPGGLASHPFSYVSGFCC
jgi:hypothetical protein